jgi:hypothetical protein
LSLILKSGISGSTDYSVPSDLDMLNGAHAVWESNGMGDYFPGNSKIAAEYLLSGDLKGLSDFKATLHNTAIYALVESTIAVDAAYELVGQGIAGQTDFGKQAAFLLSANPTWTTVEFDQGGHHVIQIIDDKGITQGLFRDVSTTPVVDMNLFHSLSQSEVSDQLAELSIPKSSTIVAGTGGAGDADAAKAAYERGKIVDFWNQAIVNELGINTGDDLQNVSIYTNQIGSVIVSKPDGTTFTINKDGSWQTHTIVNNPNGTQTEKVVGSDGTLLAIDSSKAGFTDVTVDKANIDGSKTDDFKNLTTTGAVQNEVVTDTSATGQVTATISGVGAAAYLNNAIISLAAGAQATINGNGDVTNEVVNSGTSLSVFGQNQIVNADAGSNLVNLGGTGTSATVNGGGSVGICGTNQTLTATGSTVNFSAGGFSTSVMGANDIINEAVNAGAYLGVWGQNQTVYGVSGSSRVDLNGVGTSATINGGGAVGICGTNQSVTATGSTINFSAGGFSTSIMGANNIVNEAANSGAYIGVWGSNQTIYGASGSSRVDLNGVGASATVNGGGAVGICGTNQTLTATGSTVNFSAGGFSTSIKGANDIINEMINSGAYLVVQGQNQTIYGVSGSSRVDLSGDGTTATVNGSGSSVGIFGNNTTLTTSNETVNFGVGGLTTSLYGNGDTANIWGNSGAYLVVKGQGQIVNGDTGSSHVDLTGDGTSATVNGSGSSVGIFGNNTTLTTSNEAVNFGVGGLTTSLYGSGDTANVWANSGAYLGVWGQNQIINGISGSSRVDLNGAGTSATVNGSGSSVGFCASNQTLTTTGSELVNYAADNFTTRLNGDHDIVNGGNGENLTLVGAYNQVKFGTSATISAFGSNETIGGGIGASVFADGGYDTFNLSQSKLTFGAGIAHSVVYINGDNNVIDASRFYVWNDQGSKAPVSSFTHFIVTGTGNTIYASSATFQMSGPGNDVVGTENLEADPHHQDWLGKDSHYFPNNLPDSGWAAPPSGMPNPPPNPPGGSVTIYTCPDGTDPIILNLDGGQVQTQGLENSSAFFDVQNNGQKVHTAWSTAGEGMLVYDPNNTGTVTNDSNLVAGFGALSTLAHQTGGVLDASNALWHDLKIWVDPTGNANFAEGKLESLDQLGITSINLNSIAEDISSNGNTILNDSTFAWNNGATGDIAGIDLAFDPNAVAPPAAPSNVDPALSKSVNLLIQSMAAFTGDTGMASSLSPTHIETNPMLLAAPSSIAHHA